MKTLVLKYPQYDYRVNVVVGKNIVETRNKFGSELGSLYTGNEVLGLFAHREEEFESESYIFLTKDSTVDTISHEVVHMVKRLFDRLGSYMDDSSEEIFAYNIGYAVGKIHSFVKKCRKK